MFNSNLTVEHSLRGTSLDVRCLVIGKYYTIIDKHSWKYLASRYLVQELEARSQQRLQKTDMKHRTLLKVKRKCIIEF